MFNILFFIFIFYFIIKVAYKNSLSFTSANNSLISLLNRALKNQQFYNIKTIFSDSQMLLIQADTHGENYLFALNNSLSSLNNNLLTSIYEKSQKFHIHNVVIVVSSIKNCTSQFIAKAENYGFELWDTNKLISLSIKSDVSLSSNDDFSYTKSVLKTSDISNDNCIIDTSDQDPIQSYSKAHSFLGRIFNKPDKL